MSNDFYEWLLPVLKKQKDFDPSQPRDDSGKWSETGAGDGGSESEGNGGERKPKDTKPLDVKPDSPEMVTVYQGTDEEGVRAWNGYDLTGLAGPVEEETPIEEEKYQDWIARQEEHGYTPMAVWVSDDPKYSERYGEKIVKVRVPRNQLIYHKPGEFMMPSDADYEVEEVSNREE